MFRDAGLGESTAQKSGTSTLSAFRVNGEATVPEPVSFFLVGAGLTLIAGRRLVGVVSTCKPRLPRHRS